MKWLGAMCIAGAAVWGRWQQLDLARRQRETQERMTAALRQMAEEIRVARTPMPALLDCLGRSCDEAVGGFFQTAAEGLRRGRELGAAWRRALACLDLPAEAMTALRELAAGLQGDEEGVCRALALAIDRLERQARMREQHRLEIERRENAMWFSASALLVILLI